MAKRKKRIPKGAAPLLQIGGATKDTVAVLSALDRRLEQALTLGRDAPAQEIAKEIGRLGSVSNVNITNNTFGR